MCRFFELFRLLFIVRMEMKYSCDFPILNGSNTLVFVDEFGRTFLNMLSLIVTLHSRVRCIMAQKNASQMIQIKSLMKDYSQRYGQV